jgi:hypothetical protein
VAHVWPCLGPLNMGNGDNWPSASFCRQICPKHPPTPKKKHCKGVHRTPCYPTHTYLCMQTHGCCNLYPTTPTPQNRPHPADKGFQLQCNTPCESGDGGQGVFPQAAEAVRLASTVQRDSASIRHPGFPSRIAQVPIPTTYFQSSH